VSVHLLLSCGGCDATAQVGPLVKRFHGLGGKDYGFGVAAVASPESLTPEGWIMFDPYTYCTYCPTCWQGILTAAEEAVPPAPAEVTR
jgi:hypothetical protein